MAGDNLKFEVDLANKLQTKLEGHKADITKMLNTKITKAVYSTVDANWKGSSADAFKNLHKASTEKIKTYT